MSAVAASLAGLLTINADINYYTQQSIFWNAKYENNLAKLEEQQGYETTWEDAYDDAKNGTSKLKLKVNGVYQEWDPTDMNGKKGLTDDQARQYADFKAGERYNKELLLELADKDIEYETMKCMLDTMLETLRAKQESYKTLTSTAAQDTGLLDT